MSRFNIVEVVELCPNCGRRGVFDIQFKFGHLDLSRYRVGDQIRWGENAVGSPGMSSVVVDGVRSSACIHCGHSEEVEEHDDYYIFFAADLVIEARRTDGSYSFLENNFIELR